MRKSTVEAVLLSYDIIEQLLLSCSALLCQYVVRSPLYICFLGEFIKNKTLHRF